MLTPAEELGLSGLSIASRVRQALFKAPEPQLIEIIHRIHEEAMRQRVIYLRDGQSEAINIMACPLTALPTQLAYIHSVSLTIQNCLKRLVELYMQDFSVREI